MVSKVGLVLPDLNASQLSFFGVSHVNTLLYETTKYDFCIFYQDVMPPCIRPNCASMSYNEIWTHDGLLIATNLDTAEACLNTVSGNQVALYCNDLEWLRKGGNNFERNLNVYRNVDYLIARSKMDKRRIWDYCNREPDLIAENFNVRKILEFVDKTAEIG